MTNVRFNPDLPPELVTAIAQFCDPVTCAKASLVSRLWRDIFSEQFFAYNGDINYQNIDSITKTFDISRIVSISGSLMDCDINRFPNLRSITGNIQCLQDIVTLDNFRNLTTVGGCLSFCGCTGLTSVDGLQNLTTVGGCLSFFECTGLTSVDGLQNLTTVGECLSFYQCTGLTSVDGLRNLTTVGGYLMFCGCTGLSSVEGLRNLYNVAGFLSFSRCAGLSSVEGLRNLTTIGGFLNLNACTGLTSVEGLRNLTVGRNLYLKDTQLKCDDIHFAVNGTIEY
jgi:hypothetical protein